jgi:hypothetical protein
MEFNNIFNCTLGTTTTRGNVLSSPRQGTAVMRLTF